jgi:hypothetical protein
VLPILTAASGGVLDPTANKVIIIEDGNEYINNRSKISSGLNISIKGNNNIVKLDLPIKTTNCSIDINNCIFLRKRTTCPAK